VDQDAALEYVQANEPNETQKDIMQIIINSVTLQIEAFTRKPWVSRSFTELYDGDDGAALFLRKYPIVSITSVKRLNRDGTTAATYASSDFVIAAQRGTIEFVNGGGFYKGFQNYEVVYVAGVAAVPADVRLAALEAIGVSWDAYDSKRLGLESVSFEGETKTFVTDDLPKRTKQKLARHRAAVLI